MEWYFNHFNTQSKANKKTERREKGTYLSPWPGPARPSPLATASHPPPLARRTRGAWPAPAATRRPPPASTDTQDLVYECHTLSLVPLSLSPHSPCPSPSSGSLPIPYREELVATVAVHHGHRPSLISSTCPRAPPTSSSSSRASHDASDALQRRYRHLLQPRSPDIPLAAPLAPVLPQARRGHSCTPCELLFLLP